MGRVMAQAVECLSSKHEARSSNSHTKLREAWKRKKEREKRRRERRVKEKTYKAGKQAHEPNHHLNIFLILRVLETKYH
jgi:hypothetical protein